MELIATPLSFLVLICVRWAVGRRLMAQAAGRCGRAASLRLPPRCRPRQPGVLGLALVIDYTLLINKHHRDELPRAVIEIG